MKSQFAKIGLAIALGTVSSMALAFPTQALLKRAHIRAPKSAANLFPNCTDFSGIWVGKCSYSDGDTDERARTVITQNDCSAMEMDGVDIEIGGSTRVGVTSLVNSFGFDANMALAWNASRRVLSGPASVSVVSQDGLGNYASVGSYAMAIEDGKLHTTDLFNGAAPDTASGILSSDCFYEKAPSP